MLSSTYLVFWKHCFLNSVLTFVSIIFPFRYGTKNYDRVSDFIERQAEALSPYGRDSQPWTEYHVTYGSDFNKDNVAIRTKLHAITMMK